MQIDYQRLKLLEIGFFNMWSFHLEYNRADIKTPKQSQWYSYGAFNFWSWRKY